MTSLLTLLMAALVTAHPDYSDTWDEYKLTYNKQYTSEEEESMRQGIWTDRVNMISGHNEEADAGVHSFRLGENHLADFTSEEIVSMMNGLSLDFDPSNNKAEVSEDETSGLPDSVDWRTKGFVTHIKDQKHCGSCWAFSAVGSMEGANFNATGKLVSLSEQNLVDCAQHYGNHGCFGGLMDNAFKYVIANKGIDTESSYPYTAKDGKKCLFSNSTIGATITGFKDIPSGSEKALQEAVATVGPVSVAIDASKPTFHFYKSGVYFDRTCSNTHLDHGVLAVGYGADENGKSYWIVKNSWGVAWGMKGYINMARDKNNACGIARAASYPTV